MRYILIALWALISITNKAQVALSFYPFQSQLSISTSPDRLIWGDLRTETNTFISNMNTEIGPMLNVKRSENLNCYIGAGPNFNLAYVASTETHALNGYFVSFGARVKPFVKNRNVHLIFELSPYVNSELKSGNLRARLGVGYNFIRRSKSDSPVK